MIMVIALVTFIIYETYATMAINTSTAYGAALNTDLTTGITTWGTIISLVVILVVLALFGYFSKAFSGRGGSGGFE
jgi:hypothetical protein